MGRSRGRQVPAVHTAYCPGPLLTRRVSRVDICATLAGIGSTVVPHGRRWLGRSLICPLAEPTGRGCSRQCCCCRCPARGGADDHGPAALHSAGAHARVDATRGHPGLPPLFGTTLPFLHQQYQLSRRPATNTCCLHVQAVLYWLNGQPSNTCTRRLGTAVTLRLRPTAFVSPQYSRVPCS